MCKPLLPMLIDFSGLQECQDFLVNCLSCELKCGLVGLAADLASGEREKNAGRNLAHAAAAILCLGENLPFAIFRGQG